MISILLWTLLIGGSAYALWWLVMRQSKPVPAGELTVALVVERLAREAARGGESAGRGRHRAAA